MIIFCSNLLFLSQYLPNFRHPIDFNMPFGGRKLLGCMGKFKNAIYPYPDGSIVDNELLEYYSSTSRRENYHTHERDCSLPRDVLKGCLAVYVGRERRRFVVPNQHLNHHLFKSLLDDSAKEFGFHYIGGIIIPCEVRLFQYLLWLIEHNHPPTQILDLDQLLNDHKFGQSKSLPHEMHAA
ncbi:hypothetical protein O6H91_09G066800 [Diphasiastrum complanatum]|uniref:Uncharacterized protein n=1 Tax=Diphasiastrum complanatum TaxID=34168 RepID=A0ACC2CQL8_DIPCM|nr:hypothetical protein O6H91_09G066800 [Diphasiastrum complanatum]